AGCAVRPWSGGGEAEVVARCGEGGAELVGVAADLGEEEAALDAGHGGSGERGGVGVVAQLAAGFHAGEAVAEVRFPAFETCGDRCSGSGSLSASWPAREPIGQPPRACCSNWCWTMKSNQ